MTALDHARKRIAVVIEEVERLKQSEFPYDHPRSALEILAVRFAHLRDVLNKVDPSEPPERVLSPCIISLEELFTYVPFLGFILRSTNVRNAFEAYAPLLRLARTILGSDTKLIISSEWDYSPYVYSSTDHLAGFVMIGLPAPESANPLLIPLAGHELGHTTWESLHFSDKFRKQIEALVLQDITEKRWKDYASLYPLLLKEHFIGNDILARPIFSTAYTWAFLQTEEIFCDFFGIRLFAESYLHAFGYLLSPGLPGERSVRYPNMISRVSHLVEAAKKMEVEVELGFVDCFRPSDDLSDPKTKLLVSTADTVSASLVPDLIKLAQEFADNKAVPKRDFEKVSEINAGFNRVIPTAKQHSLTDILNAGWNSYMMPELWKEIRQIKQENRDRILKDIMLKSIEVSEAFERIGEAK